MFKQPEKSPWGAVRDCDTLCYGVFMITAPEGGGIMVSTNIASFLSPAAREHGIRAGGYLCYEGNTEEVIVLRELLDKKLWEIPPWIEGKAAFEEKINDTLRQHYPDYWRSREHGCGIAPPVPAKHTAVQHDR